MSSSADEIKEMLRLLQESFNIFADEQRIQGTQINDLDAWMLKAKLPPLFTISNFSSLLVWK